MGSTNIFSTTRSHKVSQVTRLDTKILTNSTKIKKLVPQRGWNLRCLRIFSTVRGKPFSRQKMVLCSAP